MAKKKEQSTENGKGDNGEAHVGIISRSISEEMKEAYLDYAMSVITSRALPDVRDGLKPVHRRILFTMHQMGLSSGARFRKCAAVVGDVLGKYHPHGDSAVYDALAQLAQDFKTRYPLIMGQGNFGCFTGDTKVKLTDGRELSFLELIKEQNEGKRHWTFSFNHATEQMEVAEVSKPRCTRKNSELVKVVLDNGEQIRCTPDHRFMLRDGVYREAQFLQSGDSLMPLYTRAHDGAEQKNLKGYTQVLQPMTQQWEFAHHMADAWNLADGAYDRAAGRVRHHKDFDKYNNNPENIQRMQWSDHWRLHAELASWRHKNDAVYVQKLAEGRATYIQNNRALLSERASKRNKEAWEDPVYRSTQIARLKAMWEDEEYRAFMCEQSSKNLKRLWQDPAFQKLISENKSKEMKKRWEDPAYREHMSTHMQEISQRLWSDPAHREYMSRRMKEVFANPAHIKRLSEISKERWQDPAYRAKYSEDHFVEMARELWEKDGIRAFHSEKAKKQWRDDTFRSNIITAISRSNKRRLEENPHMMQEMAQQSAASLREKWKDEEYKKQVVRSKVLRHVKRIIEKYGAATPELYEKERTANGTLKIEKALPHFNNFNEMVESAKTYNHKVVSVSSLNEREDVYDITIDALHNFALAAGVLVHNSIDGDSPAAMRYTEAKMARISSDLLRDLEKDTVEWRANYDSTRKEPIVMPAGFPNLLVNGTLGIAVGMATNIPPHNLKEVCDATMHLIDNPDATVDDLFEYIQGPDFPTGAIIYNQKEIKHAYATGRGGIVTRGHAEIVEDKKGQFNIIITSIPYRVNKADMITKIADLVRDKKIEGIRELRDESTKDIRVFIGLKNTAQPQKVLNSLYKHTQLEDTFHMNMVALVDGVPQTLSLKSVLSEFITHRKEVVRRRSEFELGKAKDREHILLGLTKALDHIDEIIKLIKQSKDALEAHGALMKKFKFSDRQATAILEMRLQKLAGLERKKIEDELKEIQKLIAYLESILKSEKKMMQVVKDELTEVTNRYDEARRTKVIKSGVKSMTVEDLIPDEENVLVLTQGGYIKRTNPSEYKLQKRGGMGVIDMGTKEEDFVTTFLTASTHSDVLFFTNKGKAYQSKMYDIPEGRKATKGKAVVNFLPIASDEYVTSILAMPKEIKQAEDLSLFMVTKKGVAKRVAAKDFYDVRRSGLIAMKLSEGDELVRASFLGKKDSLILVTQEGQSIRFAATDIREMGRAASGVKAMTLKAKDHIIGSGVIPKDYGDGTLLVLSEHGYGKQTVLDEYKLQKRGGSGVKATSVTTKTGKVMAMRVVNEEFEELIVMSKKGQVIRTGLGDIPKLSRATQGVRVMKMKAGDSIAALICL